MAKIFVINPGSTSTKIALYENETEIFETSIRHTPEELQPFNHVSDQIDFRRELILQTLQSKQIPIESLDIIMGRGGLMKPVSTGVYAVNKAMLNDLTTIGYFGEHASNLGAILAYELALKTPKAKAYIADPIVTDELQPLARVTGYPDVERVSIFHALNQKAIARKYAETMGKKYEDINVIVAHLGGGVSVGAHQKGKVIDVNQKLNGDGPMSPERSGSIPNIHLVNMCFSGKYNYNDMMKILAGKGGLIAHANESHAGQLWAKGLAGDKEALHLMQAMAYQVAKEIGAMGAVLKGIVNAILITGGIAYNQTYVDYIAEYVKHIAPVHNYPGENEMPALALNGLKVLNQEMEVKEYV